MEEEEEEGDERGDVREIEGGDEDMEVEEKDEAVDEEDVEEKYVRMGRRRRSRM